MKLHKAARLLLCLTLCLLLLALCGCEKKQDPPPPPDAELVIEQYLEGRSNGLQHVKTTMKWEQGYIASIRFCQTYDTEEHAAVVYMARENELGESGDVVLEGRMLSYDVSTESWEGKTFTEVKDMMQENDEWSVIYAAEGDEVIIDVYGAADAADREADA